MAKYCRWNVFFSKYKEFFLLLGNFTAGLMKRFDMQRIKNVLINSSERLDMFHSMTPELWLYEYIHDLRRERQFDKADRLEELFANLKNGSIFFFYLSFSLSFQYEKSSLTSLLLLQSVNYLKCSKWYESRKLLDNLHYCVVFIWHCYYMRICMCNFIFAF